MIIDILKSKEYKELLIKSFDYGQLIKFGNFFSEKNLKLIKKKIKSKTQDDAAYNTIKIYKNVEFCMSIDDKCIGVFNNKYIVLFDDAYLDFEFIGDTVSNWVRFAGSETYMSEIDAFQILCNQKFNTPITVFNPLNSTIEKDVKSLY